MQRTADAAQSSRLPRWHVLVIGDPTIARAASGVLLFTALATSNLLAGVGIWTTSGPAGLNATAVGTDSNGYVLWAVDCKNVKCSSGAAAPEACEQSYKYDQVLGSESCDGTIIIEK